MNKQFADFVNSIHAFHGVVDADTDWLSPIAWTSPVAMSAARNAQIEWEEHGPCQVAEDFILEAQAIEEGEEG